MTRTKEIRWTAARKREVVAAIFANEKTVAQVLEERPDITEEELRSWMAAYERGRGEVSALRQVAMAAARRKTVLA